MFTVANIILLLTALMVALIAGLLYSYSCSVNIGLGRLSNTAYINAMQSINKAIQNPLFFISFLGAALLLPICCYLQYSNALPTKFYLLLAAAAIYLVGVIGVTILGNVPLNEALDKFNTTTSSTQEITAQRIAFEVKWNTLHTIRTIAAFISLVLVLITFMANKQEA
jgi:uncharacterized membrane protein